MKDLINAAWRYGDDSAAARWLWRYRRLKFAPQCLRYFRTCQRAYPGSTGQIMQKAFTAVQRRRKKQVANEYQ